MTAYIFDVLPVHPQPHHLETLTSYVTRLAQANGIQTAHELKQVVFPNRNIQGVLAMKDLPPKTYDRLPEASNCAETMLQNLTLAHLSTRFSHDTTPLAVGVFLMEALAGKLRYCPLCLQSEDPYYVLPWRFPYLKGCPKHGCYLLEQCSFCGKAIPFLAKPLRIGYCSFCGAALCSGEIQSMRDDERRKANIRYNDLVFLLSPMPVDQEPVPIGPRLAYWRNRQGKTIETIAEQIKQNRITAQSIERVSPDRGTSFPNYLAYSECLGLTFEELFTTDLPPDIWIRPKHISPEEWLVLTEERLVYQMEQAIADLKAQGQIVSRVKVASRIGETTDKLKRFPKSRALFEKIEQAKRITRRQRNEAVEKILMARVEQAIQELGAADLPVNPITISKHIGKTVFSVPASRYPRLRAMMDEVSREYLRTRPQRRKKAILALLAETRQVIEEMKSRGEPILKYQVLKQVDIPKTTFDRYIDFQSLSVVEKYRALYSIEEVT